MSGEVHMVDILGVTVEEPGSDMFSLLDLLAVVSFWLS